MRLCSAPRARPLPSIAGLCRGTQTVLWFKNSSRPAPPRPWGLVTPWAGRSHDWCWPMSRHDARCFQAETPGGAELELGLVSVLGGPRPPPSKGS